MGRWIVGLERRQSYRQGFPCDALVFFFPASEPTRRVYKSGSSKIGSPTGPNLTRESQEGDMLSVVML
jgi:hypothetical protein